MKMRNKASAKYMFFHPFSLANVFLFNVFYIWKCVNKIYFLLCIFFPFILSSIFNFNIYFIQHLLMTGSRFRNRNKKKHEMQTFSVYGNVENLKKKKHFISSYFFYIMVINPVLMLRFR